jgi:3-dehydroquinate synthetase
MASDIKMKRVTATGALTVGRARIRQVQVTVTDAGVGRFTLTNGVGGGVILDLDFASDNTYVADIPDMGVLSETDPAVSALTNISAATIYYA